MGVKKGSRKRRKKGESELAKKRGERKRKIGEKSERACQATKKVERGGNAWKPKMSYEKGFSK